MRIRYALLLIPLGPLLGAASVLVKAPDARATIASAMVCEVLGTGKTLGAITAEGRRRPVGDDQFADARCQGEAIGRGCREKVLTPSLRRVPSNENDLCRKQSCATISQSLSSSLVAGFGAAGGYFGSAAYLGARGSFDGINHACQTLQIAGGRASDHAATASGDR